MEFSWRFLLLTITLILCSQFNEHDCVGVCYKGFALPPFEKAEMCDPRGVTQEQMEKTAKMFRQVCQPKHKLSDDILEEGKNGIFPDTKNFKCYVSCLLDMMQVTKRGKISYEKSLKQIDQLLPDDLKPAFRKGLEACKDAAQGIKDHCESAYVLLNCFYANNPKFILP